MKKDAMAPPGAPLPADDPRRRLALADPGAEGSRRVAVAGGIYTILLTGADTGGRYCLIEMLVPPGGGPPPHRHDFEEMFSVLEGEIRLAFRGEDTTARAGQTVNVPANAPHAFRNVSDRPARLLCMCTPPGQEDFFLEVGDRVEGRDARPPELSEEDRAVRRAKAQSLAMKYRTELLQDA